MRHLDGLGDALALILTQRRSRETRRRRRTPRGKRARLALGLPLVEREAAHRQAREARVRVEQAPRDRVVAVVRVHALEQRRPVLVPCVHLVVELPQVGVLEHAGIGAGVERGRGMCDELD